MGGRQGLYADPLLYDILYTPGTAVEIDALERIERVCAGPRPLLAKRLWLEPACGTGRYLRTAAGRGRRTVGFDLDPQQLSYARERKCPPDAAMPRYHRADMKDFATACDLSPASVDFAFNPVNSLRHLLCDRDLLDHLDQMAQVLKPGAVYVVGISFTDYAWLLPEEDLWEGRRGKCHVSQLVNYLPPTPGTALGRTERVLSHLTVTRPSTVTHFDDSYQLRTYDTAQWDALIAKSPLQTAGSFDAHGCPRGELVMPYQLEALGLT